MTIEEIKKKIEIQQKNLELLCNELNKTNKRVTELEKENKKLKRKIRNVKMDIAFLEND